jgi:hypothetical protein
MANEAGALGKPGAPFFNAGMPAAFYLTGFFSKLNQ